MKSRLFRKMINSIIHLVNRFFLGFPNSIEPLLLFSFRTENELELIVWQYALAKQSLFLAVYGGGKEDVDNREANRETCRRIRNEYGDRLATYLHPYLDLSSNEIVGSHWHRWYAAIALKTEST